MPLSCDKGELRHFERSEKSLFILSVVFAASLGFAAQTHDLPFGAWKRASKEPILSPQGTTWESAGTFNPAVIFVRRNVLFQTYPFPKPVQVVMVYRAQDASGTSRLGYAESKD